MKELVIREIIDRLSAKGFQFLAEKERENAAA